MQEAGWLCWEQDSLQEGKRNNAESCGNRLEARGHEGRSVFLMGLGQKGCTGGQKIGAAQYRSGPTQEGQQQALIG